MTRLERRMPVGVSFNAAPGGQSSTHRVALCIVLVLEALPLRGGHHQRLGQLQEL